MLLVVLLLIQLAISRVSIYHNSWYSPAKLKIKTDDSAWNYCDLKCLQLESLAPGQDFVVIEFKAPLYKPDFSACYVHNKNGSYSRWFNAVNNSFFEKYCGGDSTDWMYCGKY